MPACARTWPNDLTHSAHERRGNAQSQSSDYSKLNKPCGLPEGIMTLTDARGLPVSTNRRRSLEGYEHALTLLHGYFGDPLAVIDAVLAEDPQFVLGHALRAGMLITASDRTVEPLLKESVEAAESLSDAANDRERRHIAAARAWLDGDFARSSRTYGSIVIDYPRDSLALQIAHIEDFLLGQSTMLRDRVARVLPAWSKDDDSYGYLLGRKAKKKSSMSISSSA